MVGIFSEFHQDSEAHVGGLYLLMTVTFLLTDMAGHILFLIDCIRIHILFSHSVMSDSL